jgi:hypothetical protein
MGFTPEERIRQDMYDEYVVWRLELIHTKTDMNPTEISNFEEWKAVMYPTKKPKVKKRKKLHVKN